MKKDKTAAIVHEWIEKKNVKREREKKKRNKKKRNRKEQFTRKKVGKLFSTSVIYVVIKRQNISITIYNLYTSIRHLSNV